MVRDFSNSHNCNISFGTKRVPIALKKIGSYFGKLKNTISNFQREVNSVSENIDIEKELDDKKKIKEENNNKDNE